MKKTGKLLVFRALEVLFVVFVPLAIVYLGYGGWGKEANQFKIYFGALFTAIMIFLVVKRVVITPWIERQNVKAGNLEAQLEMENDPGKIANIEYALRTTRFIETVFNWVLPMAFLTTAFIAARAMEQEIVKFSGIIGFVLISEFLGFIFGCVAALCVDSKHKKTKKGGNK